MKSSICLLLPRSLCCTQSTTRRFLPCFFISSVHLVCVFEHHSVLHFYDTSYNSPARRYAHAIALNKCKLPLRYQPRCLDRATAHYVRNGVIIQMCQNDLGTSFSVIIHNQIEIQFICTTDLMHSQKQTHTHRTCFLRHRELHAKGELN